jgi:hypothetical protein
MLAFATTTGCFVPPEAPYQTDKNTPPRLVMEGPEPGQSITVSPSIDLIFRGQVIDPDPKPITLRFFIDFDYSQVLPLTETTVSPGIEFSRFLSGKDICDRVDTTSIHALELYVSDSGFVSASGREINTGGARDNAAWRFSCEDLPGGG